MIKNNILPLKTNETIRLVPPNLSGGSYFLLIPEVLIDEIILVASKGFSR